MFGIDTQDLQDLKIVDVKVGTGAEAKPGEMMRVHYTGWLEDGTKFDSSLDRNEPFEFPLGQGYVIQGWDKGVNGMKVGGIRRLFIPAQYGYGDRGAGSVIPPGATLIFEIQLLGVTDQGQWKVDQDVIEPVSAPDAQAPAAQ